MPIDLADYNKPIRDTLKRGGYACVYVAAISSLSLVKIGYSEDLPATIGKLQGALPAPIEVHSALWMPNQAIATKVSKVVQRELVVHKATGGWFGCMAEAATIAVEMVAFRIHSGARLLRHDQVISGSQGGHPRGVFDLQTS